MIYVGSGANKARVGINLAIGPTLTWQLALS